MLKIGSTLFGYHFQENGPCKKKSQKRKILIINTRINKSVKAIV